MGQSNRCSIEGCDTGRYEARGWCEKHYARWRLTGTTDAPDRPGRQEKIDWISESLSTRDRSVCWLDWPFGKNGEGYPTIGRSLVTHLVLASDGRPKPSPNLFALHSCDTPTCLNPRHLRWGTHAENMEDKRIRGRVRTTRHVITPEEVRIIRARMAAGAQRKALAAEMGVDPKTIWAIVRGKTRADVQ